MRSGREALGRTALRHRAPTSALSKDTSRRVAVKVLLVSEKRLVAAGLALMTASVGKNYTAGLVARPSGQRALRGSNKYLLKELLPDECQVSGFDSLDKFFSNYESRSITFIEERKIFEVTNFSNS